MSASTRAISSRRDQRSAEADTATPGTAGGAKPASLRQLANLPNERQLQDQIVAGLERLGYVVLQTGRWVRQTRCPGCGAYHTPRTGHGNVPGTPDLFVSHPALGNRWVALELKRPAVDTVLGRVAGGRLSTAQRALVEAGLVAVVRSLEEARDVLEESGL